MDIENNVVKTEDEQLIMTLADDMASAATSFSSHGYQVFIQSRDRLAEVLHDIFHKPDK